MTATATPSHDASDDGVPEPAPALTGAETVHADVAGEAADAAEAGEAAGAAVAPQVIRGTGLWRRHRPTVLAAALGLVLAMFTALALPGPVGSAVRDAASRLRLAGATGNAAAPAAVAAATSTALTKKGTGEFADLAVTVSQTRDLVDQNVAVSWQWSGADKHATKFLGSTPLADYLQIMQCWGDTAPDRRQCVFGGFSDRSASFTSTRFIFPPVLGPTTAFPVDPAESAVTLDESDFVKAGSRDVRVPFDAVNGTTVKWTDLDQNPFFGQLTTNEIVQARTRPDGTGFETFETLTFRENDGLGCADVVKGSPRRCWLVVVPRGETDVDGRRYTDFPNGQLQSSPLSLSNWQNRIAFPLGFQPVGQPCPLGAKQLPLGGVESSTQAVLRWQPALCANGGTVFSYSKLSDAVVEGGLTGPDAGQNGLGFVNAPVSSDVPSDRTLVYAPIAVSGVAIAAIVERAVPPGAPAAEVDRQGERVEDIKLTPRLVAKLLTHSYRTNVSPAAGYLRSNPVSIERDPEFIALNPEFADLANQTLELRIPTGVSYTTRLMWEWIAQDDQARDFVAGVPDEFGMRVNPFFQGLDIPQESFPKIDPFCDRDKDFPDLPLCSLDLHPYVNDFFEAAQAVVRGVSGARERDITVNPPVTKSVARQRPGNRDLLGITDTATAARFLMPTVKLRNNAGEFVAPTVATMQAAVRAMRPTGTSDVVLADPESASKSAYPLTVVTYAAAAPNQFTVAQARSFATFVRYAVGPGQTPGSAPGTLPDGYAPIGPAMRKQSLAAATDIQNRVGPRPSRTTSSEPAPDTSSATPDERPSSVPPPSTGASPAPTATALQSPVPVLQRTPPDAPVNGWARNALVIALLLGAGGLMVGPLLPRLAERLRR